MSKVAIVPQSSTVLDSVSKDLSSVSTEALKRVSVNVDAKEFASQWKKVRWRCNCCAQEDNDERMMIEATNPLSPSGERVWQPRSRGWVG